jgi:hypothetical protein
MSLEVLHFALVLFSLFQRGESAQVAPFAGCGILLARIQAELTGIEPSDHVSDWMRLAADLSPAAEPLRKVYINTYALSFSQSRL